jgi:peroxiredoxin (alkyl hydroperoxide reductase subunit C)
MASALNQKSPHFESDCYHNKVIKQVKLSDYDDYHKVLFFYPMNFTYVCPTELHELIDKSEEFAKYDCKIFCISIDTVHSHEIWANQLRTLGGLGDAKDVYFVSDHNKKICESFGTLVRSGEDEGVSQRVTYILDKNNIVKHTSANVQKVGRDIDDILRNVQCIHKLDELQGEALPCGWKPGRNTIKETLKGKLEYFDKTN